MFIVNNKDIRTTPGVVLVSLMLINFEHISHLVWMFLLLIWASKYQLSISEYLLKSYSKYDIPAAIWFSFSRCFCQFSKILNGRINLLNIESTVGLWIKELARNILFSIWALFFLHSCKVLQFFHCWGSWILF